MGWVGLCTGCASALVLAKVTCFEHRSACPFAGHPAWGIIMPCQLTLPLVCPPSCLPLQLQGVRVVLTDGAAHAVDSSELAFKLASMFAFRCGWLGG
jgi:hypothetical protein